jgi:hypothetical protein
MVHYSDGSSSGEIEYRTMQLIQLKAACRLHMAGMRSRLPLTKVGAQLGFKCRTVNQLKREVEAELTLIEAGD